MQVNVHEAKSHLSRLLELVERGESVVIARNGTPVARLVPAAQPGGFPFGVAAADPLTASGDSWWSPMNDEEAEDWTASSR